jgi:hypothetical protein
MVEEGVDAVAELPDPDPEPPEALAPAEPPPLPASQTFELRTLMVSPVGLLPPHVPPLSSVNALATNAGQRELPVPSRCDASRRSQGYGDMHGQGVDFCMPVDSPERSTMWLEVAAAQASQMNRLPAGCQPKPKPRPKSKQKP